MSPRTAEVVARAPASSHQPQHRSQRIRRRRAWTLLIMTLVLPGSAQLVAGNRRVGRLALRVWAALWLLAVLAVLLALLLPQAAFSMITSAPALAIIKIALIIFGLGWVGLLVDAWRLANPWELGRHSHIGFSVITVALAFTIFGGSIAVASIASAQHQLTTTVFSGGGDQVAQHGSRSISC